MCSDLECGVCYRTFNAARRCPRELRCHHSFCESCLLLLLWRTPGPQGAPRAISCPLCRSTTPISGQSQVRAELRVDEAVLERLMSAGVLDREEEEEEEEQQRSLPGTPAEESAPVPGTRGGRLRRSWKKVWRKMNGDRQNTPSPADADLHVLAMMSCLVF